jgi:putative ABC transport system permease protein
MVTWLRTVLVRLRAVIGVALAGLRHDRTRSVLAVFGIALAVVATTTLAGTGYGVIATGEERFESADRDMWITGGPVQFAPGTVGGVENSLYDAHEVSAEIERRGDVRNAVPMSFQTVYVGQNDSEFETLVGVGAPARGGSVQITEGEQFSQRDVHYANGTYDGPMTHEVVIDERTATLLNVSVGDTLHIGGTIADARQHEFTIVGISPTFSRFLGTPTVVVQLSELQEITGTTGTDSASLITVTLADGADPETVSAELEQEYPEYEIRTNREQLQATLERQAVVLASGASLVGLAVIAGIALTVNLLLGLVYQQRRELAALQALGAAPSTLVGFTVVQAIALGVLGGLLGGGLTIPLAMLLNQVATALVGFENVVRTPTFVLEGGFAIALVMSILGATVAGWRVSRLSPADELG